MSFDAVVTRELVTGQGRVIFIKYGGCRKVTVYELLLAITIFVMIYSQVFFSYISLGNCVLGLFSSNHNVVFV